MVETSLHRNFQKFSKRTRYVTSLIEHFWKRFSSDYLGDLRRMNLSIKQLTSKIQNPFGDVVLLKEESLPCNRWKMGRVEKLVIGKAKLCRGARLSVTLNAGKKTSCSCPLQKLVPLIQPISTSKESCARSESAVCNDNILEWCDKIKKKGRHWRSGLAKFEGKICMRQFFGGV